MIGCVLYEAIATPTTTRPTGDGQIIRHVADEVPDVKIDAHCRFVTLANPPADTRWG